MNQQQNLKPCPFCGCMTGYCTDNQSEVLTLYFIECPECLAQGPCEQDELTAIHNWNNRFKELDNGTPE